MPIFIKNDLSVLYIHVPKTGGGTVLQMFKENGFTVHYCDTSNITAGFNSYRRCSPQHYHADLLSATLRLERFDYAFMSVREPINRLKSEFLWRCYANGTKEIDPNAWARHIFSRYRDNPFILDNHIRPQHEFVMGSVDVFKYEEMFTNDWYNQLSKKIGLIIKKPRRSLHVSKDYSGRKVSNIEFDPSISKKIIDFYEIDFSEFGYVHRK